MFNTRKIQIGEEIIQEIKKGEIIALNEKIKELEGRLEKASQELITLSKSTDNCSKGLNQLSQPWTLPFEQNIGTQSNQLYIDDPIYGCISIDAELVPILNHPIVTRLQYIKQLSFAAPFPSATHTRLSHSLGVAYLMEEALKTIFHKNVMYFSPVTSAELLNIKLADGVLIEREGTIDIDKEKQKEIILVAKAAALLHDIGHGPFSHTIDRFIGYYHPDRIRQYADKKFSLIFLNAYLKKLIKDDLNLKYDRIEAILSDDESTKTEYCALITSILNSAGDVDRLDYLVRDSHFSGLPIGWVSARTIIEHMIPVKCSDGTVQLCFREEVLPYFQHFLYSRVGMYTNCYEHPKKLAAERMILKAVIDFYHQIPDKKSFFDQLKLLTDEQLLALILMNTSSEDNSSKLVKCLLNGIIFEEIFSTNIKNPTKVSENGSDDPSGCKQAMGVSEFLDERNLKMRYIEKVDHFEKKFTSDAGLPEGDCWKIALHFPPEEAFNGTETRVPILKHRDGKTVIVSAWTYREFMQVHDFIRDSRLKVKIFVYPGLSGDQKNQIINSAKKIFEKHA